MCGIAGIFGRTDAGLIDSMLAAIAHRGPDDGYAVSGEDFSLGVRRLSIVDVANGRQPLCNEDRSVWAAQNGELYNFPEQRRCLERKRHIFLTQCDTEMLPHLYEEHGADLPAQLQGMFAVALWDVPRRKGLLVRDRMGKKPLYYAEVDGTLYFASELKALIGVPGLDLGLNLEAVHHFLSYKHVPNPLSIFAGIRMLPPAHSLTYEFGRPLKIRRYWRPDFSEQDEYAAMSEEDITDRLLVLLRQGVKRRLMADVPIGFFLSGGIDSSLSTALAAEEASGRIQTFTLTYGENSTTAGKEADRRWARYVAERYGTEHYEEVVTFGKFPETISPILRAFDEPFAGAVSTYFLAQRVTQHVKVALGGDGADELFGSYRTHRLAEPLARLPEYLRTGNTALVAPFESEIELLERLWEPEDWAWKAKLFVLSDAEKATLYSPDVARQMANWPTSEHLRQSFTDLTATDPLNRVLEAEFHGLLPDQVLTFVDRLSMAHSLELRTAFLDTDVVSFVAGISGRRKIVRGETKRLLKQVARRFFPPAMVDRSKEGFVMPVTDWILSGLEPYVRDTLSGARLARHGLFNQRAVHTLIESVYAGDGGYAQANKLLVLLTFQEWHDLYLN
jgi:asparagine synthase (glutamine-hydrolysing)